MELYPIKSDPRNMRVRGVQSSGHDCIAMHQAVPQVSTDTGVHTGPGHRGSVQVETLSQAEEEKRRSVTVFQILYVTNCIYLLSN